MAALGMSARVRVLWMIAGTIAAYIAVRLVLLALV